MTHTPGPWHAFAADYQRAHDAALLPIFVVGPQEFHTVCQVRPGCEDDDLPAETEANARLIAAAPDLLAALLTVLDQVDYAADPPNCQLTEMVGAVLPEEVIKIARSAIAKAEGAA